MSHGRVVHERVAERDAATAAKLRADAMRAARQSRAHALVVEKFPDLCGPRVRQPDGEPCGWAVMAVADLWVRHGEGHVKPSQVRAERRRRLDRLAAAIGFDPTREDAPA